MVRFGVSGVPPGDVSDEEFLDRLVEDGHGAYELAFVKDFPWKERRCAAFGEAAAERGIDVSVHAPYFAILTVEEEEKAAQCLAALEHTMKLGKALGSKVICAHAGHVGDRTAEELTQLVRERLERIAPKLDHLGVGLGLETSGTDRAFGSLGDIALFASEFDFVRPVVDWAHLHAKTGGGLTSMEAFAAVFDFIAQSFPAFMIDPLQCQFTDNQVGPRGEIKHLPYGEGTLRVAPLVEAAAAAGLDMTLISEAKEQSSHEAILDEIRRSEATAVSRSGRLIQTSDIEFPSPIRVDTDAKHVTPRLPTRRPTLSNLDKVFFPKAGYTKGDLIQYYASVADVLVPHLAGRPISMSRYPDGIDGPSFYEKRAPSHAPDWMETAPVPSDSMGGVIDFLLASDRESLMWFANMGCIEMHPFHGRQDALDKPDYAIFDFDPAEGSTWDQVIAGAKLLGQALDRLGLNGYPKLSGSRGLHVYVPIERIYDQSRVRRFVDGLGQLLAAADPDTLTMEWDIPKRKGKVFVDANRNASGQTVASVYSVRPRPGAPVSAPIRWDEIEELRNGDVTIANLWDRLRRHGDLFAPVLEGGQHIEDAEEAIGL